MLGLNFILMATKMTQHEQHKMTPLIITKNTWIEKFTIVSKQNFLSMVCHQSFSKCMPSRKNKVNQLASPSFHGQPSHKQCGHHRSTMVLKLNFLWVVGHVEITLCYKWHHVHLMKSQYTNHVEQKNLTFCHVEFSIVGMQLKNKNQKR